jgi:hypothetical protein
MDSFYSMNLNPRKKNEVKKIKNNPLNQSSKISKQKKHEYLKVSLKKHRKTADLIQTLQFVGKVCQSRFCIPK